MMLDSAVTQLCPGGAKNLVVLHLTLNRTFVCFVLIAASAPSTTSTCVRCVPHALHVMLITITSGPILANVFVPIKHPGLMSAVNSLRS